MAALHPLTKVICLVLFSLLVFGLSNPIAQVFLLILVLIGGFITNAWAGVRARRLRGLALFAAFIFIVQIMFIRGGQPLLRLPLIGNITDYGLISGINMALRFFNIIAASSLFVSITDPTALAYGLMQAGLPYRYGFMLVTAMRFLPLIGSETEAVRAAQLARGVGIDRPSLQGIWELVRYTLIPLTVSSLSRVDSLTISMEGRAFGLYKKRSYRQSMPLQRQDKLIILCSVVFTTAALWLGPHLLPVTNYLTLGYT